MAASRTKVIITVIAVAVIGYFAYGRFMPHGGWGQQGGAVPVSVAEVIERDVRPWHEFSGRLVAVDHVEIRPQVSGIIDDVHFKDGAMVAKGDPLFTIDPRPYEAAFQSAAANAAFAQSELKRGASLLADKAIPQHDYDQKKDAAETAAASLTTAKLNLEYTHIASPIAGRVSRAEITQGNLVTSGSSSPLLTTVISYHPIYADFEIDEGTFMQYAEAHVTGDKDASAIPVEMGLSGENGAPHKGRIESFDNRLDSATGTMRVRAVFDNQDGMMVPGLFARIQLGSAADTHSILITDRAVGTDQDKKFVLVVGSDNKVEYRVVKLGPLADNLRIVSEGLKPGEKIIVSGTQRARPGQPVTPEVVPMEDKSPESGAQSSEKPEKKETP